MALVKVAKVGEVGEGSMVPVEVQGKKLLVARVDGSFYAIDAVCSHMGGDLARGKLSEGIVKCPRHGAEYDVRTGELVKDVGGIAKAINRGRGAKGQAVFKVLVKGDHINVDV